MKEIKQTENEIVEQNLLQKLSAVQQELKAPKGQKNTFGNYRYRSCEDILEAVKPLLARVGLSLVLSDELVAIGNSSQRYYIKATATLYDINDGTPISNTAYAREEETKKGMDGSQITGTASSYARKYALNGLFNIDDTKDADTDEYTKQTKIETTPKKEEIKNVPLISKQQTEIIVKSKDNEIVKNALAYYKKEIDQLTIAEASTIIRKLLVKKEGKENE